MTWIDYLQIYLSKCYWTAFFGNRLFNWFGFSISDLFGTTSSLVDNYNSVCNSVLSLSVDSLDLRLDKLPSGDFGMEILD